MGYLLVVAMLGLPGLWYACVYTRRLAINPSTEWPVLRTFHVFTATLSDWYRLMSSPLHSTAFSRLIQESPRVDLMEVEPAFALCLDATVTCQVLFGEPGQYAYPL